MQVPEILFSFVGAAVLHVGISTACLHPLSREINLEESATVFPAIMIFTHKVVTKHSKKKEMQINKK